MKVSAESFKFSNQTCREEQREEEENKIKELKLYGHIISSKKLNNKINFASVVIPGLNIKKVLKNIAQSLKFATQRRIFIEK